MNRRQIRITKTEIEKKLVPVGKRIVSLEKEYNALRAQIEPLPGDSPERADLHKKAALKLAELQAKNSEFTLLMQEHNKMTYASKYNRDNNGKASISVKDGPHNHIPPA